MDKDKGVVLSLQGILLKFVLYIEGQDRAEDHECHGRAGCGYNFIYLTFHDDKAELFAKRTHVSQTFAVNDRHGSLACFALRAELRDGHFP